MRWPWVGAVVVARSAAEQAALVGAQGALVAGLSEDFVGLVEWACRLDAVQAITLDGITEAWQASHGTADNGSPAVQQLLADCADRIRASWTKVRVARTRRAARNAPLWPASSAATGTSECGRREGAVARTRWFQIEGR